MRNDSAGSPKDNGKNVEIGHDKVSSSNDSSLAPLRRYFREAQKDRTLHHPMLPQQQIDISDSNSNSNYTFVVAADTQLGMTRSNQSWEEEKEYSRQAVAYLNGLVATVAADSNEDNNNNHNPLLRPLFCCICGDLVHMTAEIYATQKNDSGGSGMSRDECDQIQDAQFDDFQDIWSTLHPDIALVCLCGNHDVGNRPTRTSIQRFSTRFGDDYLAFWVQQSYHIVVNTSLFNDKSGAPEYYQGQLTWLEQRLRYAQERQAQHIFVFGHHPLFLYHEDEDETQMTSYSPIPSDWVPGGGKVNDAYFVIPRHERKRILALFAKYGVTAAFAGHFHQNMVSQTSFGMAMIVTSSLSVVLESNGIPANFAEPKRARGLRLVHVPTNGRFHHEFVSLE